MRKRMDINSVITSDTATSIVARPVDALLKVSVYQVARTSYQSLNATIRHPHWAISHVADGNVLTTTAGLSFQARTGSVLIHPPGLQYIEYAEQAGAHNWFIFEAQTSQNVALFDAYPLSLVVALSSTDTFAALFDQLLTAWADTKSPRWHRDMEVSRHTTEILHLLIEDWIKSGAVPRPGEMLPEGPRFADLIAYITGHAHQHITRADLAARVCLHPNSLDRLFRATYGITPMRMLTNTRLRIAREMLGTTDHTLDTIADACGFEDATYFIRVFKASFHTTPGRYRGDARKSRQIYSSTHPDYAAGDD